MRSFFVPYSGGKPASVSINGHRVIILSFSKEGLEESLELVGADRVRRVKGGRSKKEREQVLSRLAKSVNGGVVIAPSDIEIQELIRNLESQLPWVH